jgi:hypothetical protein
MTEFDILIKKRHRNTSNETIESGVWPPKDVTHAAQRA